MRLTDQGASAVEFAIIVPLLFVLILGIINFGVLFGQQLALNHAVREGARAAVVQATGVESDGMTPAAIAPLVRNSVNMVSMAPADVTVTSGWYTTNPNSLTTGTCPGNGGKQNLKVSASYPATLAAPMPVPGFPSSFTLKADAVFRCEW